VDISYACMQASPDLAYGARVQFIVGLEENRRNKLGVWVQFSSIFTFSVLFSWSYPKGPPQEKH